jgi:hypothetical protein
MKRVLCALLCIHVMATSLSCRSDRNYGVNRTRASLGRLEDHFRKIKFDNMANQCGDNFDEFWEYLTTNGFVSVDRSELGLDGWHRPFRLYKTVLGTKTAYMVVSAGRDGEFGNADDLFTGLE